MNVEQYAKAAGVTPRRVRALIGSGTLEATKVGHGWVIDSPVRRPSARRPLSRTSRDALALALHTRGLGGLKGHLRTRTASRMRQLRESSDPASLLVDWWGGTKPTRENGGTNLVTNAIKNNNNFIKFRVNNRPIEYLRDRADLADVVSTERTIQGLTRADLAKLADVNSALVTAIELAHPVESLAGLRRVLRAINVEVSALPQMEPK